jgi:hypothetical protein
MTNDHRGARYYDPFLALVAAKEAHQMGEFEGACPLMHAPPRAVRDRAAAVSEGCRGAPCHVLSVAKV